MGHRPAICQRLADHHSPPNHLAGIRVQLIGLRGGLRAPGFPGDRSLHPSRLATIQVPLPLLQLRPPRPNLGHMSRVWQGLGLIRSHTCRSVAASSLRASAPSAPHEFLHPRYRPRHSQHSAELPDANGVRTSISLVFSPQASGLRLALARSAPHNGPHARPDPTGNLLATSTRQRLPTGCAPSTADLSQHRLVQETPEPTRPSRAVQPRARRRSYQP